MSASQFENIEKEIRMGMNLIERDEFTSTIKAISHIAAETVFKTLGPYAHTTIIDDGNFTYPTKDGWSILQRLRFQDPTHNSIFNMLKNISFRIVDKVGDGTTTAMVTADHFMHLISEGLDQEGVMTKYRQADIVSALNDVRDMIIADLEKHAIQIAPDAADENPQYEEIYRVAYVSSNGNEKLARIMQEIYQKTHNPNILVDMDGGKDLTYEIQTGYRLDCQFLMHERYSNTTEHYYDTMGRPHNIAVFDHNVSYQKHAALIEAMLQDSTRQQRPLILMAPYFDDIISSMFATLIQENLKKNPNAIPGLMIIQIPEMTRAAQRNAMSDFATLSGVTPINATKVKVFEEMRYNASAPEGEQIHDKAMELEEYHFTTAQQLVTTCYGTIYNATIGKSFFSLKDYNTESILYKERYAQVKAEFEKAKKDVENSPTNLTKAFLEASQRLNKLSGALGVIHVGGVTELERQCTRDVVDDTFLACRSAYENGVVAGLNLGVMTAMFRVGNERANTMSELQKFALSTLANAYLATSEDILANKYPNGNDEKPWKFVNGETFGNHDFIYQLINALDNGDISSYDIVNEECCTDKIPAVCNSVSTDIEILYGITGILGMVMTSDQYMSVSRMYDKTAAIRQQETINERATANTVNTILTAVDKYIDTNGTSGIVNFLNAFKPIDPRREILD